MSHPTTTNRPAAVTTTGRGPASRTAGVCFLVGVLLYVAPTVLHGNPPIDDAEATLRYVADRELWTLAHFANIAAVVLWAAGVALMTPASRIPRAMATMATTVWSIAAAVFSVYYGLHAVGLKAAADQLEDPAVPDGPAVERAEALLHVLGSTAFVGQALLGTAVAMLGLLLLRAAGPGARTSERMLGGSGLAIGIGWAMGAVLINFAIIVPFTTLAWIWFVVLGVLLVRRRGELWR